MDIRFPPPGSDEPDKVTVMGLPDTVDNAIDHLLNLEEEYVGVPVNSRQTCIFFFQSFSTWLLDAQPDRDGDPGGLHEAPISIWRGRWSRRPG